MSQRLGTGFPTEGENRIALSEFMSNSQLWWPFENRQQSRARAFQAKESVDTTVFAKESLVNLKGSLTASAHKVSSRKKREVEAHSRKSRSVKLKNFYAPEDQIHRSESRRVSLGQVKALRAALEHFGSAKALSWELSDHPNQVQIKTQGNLPPIRTKLCWYVKFCSAHNGIATHSRKCLIFKLLERKAVINFFRVFFWVLKDFPEKL